RKHHQESCMANEKPGIPETAVDGVQAADLAVPVEPNAGVARSQPELTSREKFKVVGWAIFNRLRFIAVLVSVGLFIGYWDTLMNYWDKWVQSGNVAARQLDPDHEFYCPMDPQVVRTSYE